SIWGRVSKNKNTNKKNDDNLSTWLYMDEFHLLLKDEQTTAYAANIYKRFRKHFGIPTAITQNVSDSLSYSQNENIFKNSPFIIMFEQAEGDRRILAGALGISKEQLRYVTQSGTGEGLLFLGNTVLPFVDRFPRNTKMYKLMTTNPNDK
ncbi:MAG: conjugal transfer protein TraE, partial [Defluviitaleaceae bacterium]|nr:conjugal transfer protein TraE [Defluviitaleaceae bacterium]